MPQECKAKSDLPLLASECSGSGYVVAIRSMNTVAASSKATACFFWLPAGHSAPPNMTDCSREFGMATGTAARVQGHRAFPCRACPFTLTPVLRILDAAHCGRSSGQRTLRLPEAEVQIGHAMYDIHRATDATVPRRPALGSTPRACQAGEDNHIRAGSASGARALCRKP
jgi:hypothetical protein